jgi:hypothetical protein
MGCKIQKSGKAFSGKLLKKLSFYSLYGSLWVTYFWILQRMVQWGGRY